MSYAARGMSGLAARLVLAATLTLSLAASAGVERTVTEGPDWTRVEEPGLRPVKAIWQGFKAVGYHSSLSLAEGNEKFPGIGSIEVLRGLRRGTIELVSNTYMSMAGSRPRPYTHVGQVNRFIERDPLLRNAADAAVGLGAASAAGAAQPAIGAAGIYGTQKIVDRAPLNPVLRQEFAAERRHQRELRRRAQENYLGDRAHTNSAPPGRGNLLREYR